MEWVLKSSDWWVLCSVALLRQPHIRCTFGGNEKSSCCSSHLHLPSIVLIHLYRGFAAALLTNPGSGTSLCSLVQHHIHHFIWFFQRNTRHTVKMPLSPMYRKHARLKEIMLLIQVLRGRKYEINSNLGLLRLLPVLCHRGCKEGL